MSWKQVEFYWRLKLWIPKLQKTPVHLLTTKLRWIRCFKGLRFVVLSGFFVKILFLCKERRNDCTWFTSVGAMNTTRGALSGVLRSFRVCESKTIIHLSLCKHLHFRFTSNTVKWMMKPFANLIWYYYHTLAIITILIEWSDCNVFTLWECNSAHCVSKKLGNAALNTLCELG